MTTISLRGVSKRFAETAAIADVSLDFPKGSFTALLGPSGCGKTTLLRLIAGFEQPSAGTISFNDKIIASQAIMVAPEHRKLGIVFQSYALWPHMDVAANVAYPLKSQGIGRAEVEKRVARALDMVSMSGFGGRSIDALSGGQRQRVALARCLVADTDVILLDEPLANLDVHLRAAMIDAFADIHARTGATIVYVTHDQAEALALADQVAVLHRGTLQQTTSPQELYAQPANATVAGFVGRGAIIPALAEGGDILVNDYRFQARGLDGRTGPVQILLRPEGLREAGHGLSTKVERVSFKGPVYEVTLVLGDGSRLMIDSKQPFTPDEMVQLAVTDAWVIPA